MSFGWNQTLNRLKAGDYQGAATSLEQARQHYAHDSLLTTTLGIAQKLCLICLECATATTYHQQALIGMSEQLDKISTEILVIIDLLQRIETDSAGELRAAPGTSETQRHTLWQWLQNRLGRAHVVAQPVLFNRAPAVPNPIPDQRTSVLAVCCLGPFRVYQHDHPVEDWPSRKGKLIFKYLIMHRDRPVPKEVLMDLLWPDSSPDAARNNLNVAIYALRQSLRQNNPDQSYILYQDDCYLINPDLNTWVDVDAFKAHVKHAHHLESIAQRTAAIREYHLAEALCLGEFLEEDRYEDWVSSQRQALKDTYMNVLERLSYHYFSQSDYTTCVVQCHKILSVEPCRENAHRWIMQCYAQQGQRYLAIRQYQDCIEALRSELDVEPSAETTRLYEQILAGEPTTFPALLPAFQA